MRWIIVASLVAGCGDDGGSKQTDASVTDGIDLDGEGIPDAQMGGNGGQAVWAKHYGEAGDVYVNGMAVDGGGGSLYAGYFAGTINFANTGPSGSEALSSSNAAYAAKLDENGTHVFSKMWTSSGSSIVTMVAAAGANNDAYFGGYFDGTTNLGGNDLTSGTQTVFIAKFASDGTHVWSKAFGGTTTIVHSASTDGNGNVVIAGSFSGSIDFGGGALTSAGGSDFFVAVFNSANGNYIWANRFGDGADQPIIMVAVDKTTGAMNLTGRFAGIVNFGGTNLTATGTSGFIAQLAANGSHQWSKVLATATPTNIATDPAGNVYYTGAFTGTVDFAGTGAAANLTAGSGNNIFLVKLLPGGGHSFSRYFNSSSPIDSVGVAASSMGVSITGQFRTSGPAIFSAGGVTATALTCDAGRAFYAASFTPAGAHKWSFCTGMGSGTHHEGLAIAAASTGHVFVHGDYFMSTTASIAFVKSGGGTITLPRTADTDAFVAKLEP